MKAKREIPIEEEPDSPQPEPYTENDLQAVFDKDLSRAVAQMKQLLMKKKD